MQAIYMLMSRVIRTLGVLACVFLLTLISRSQRAVAAGNYEMLDLGHLGGGYSSGEDINDVGQIVGVSSNTAGQHRAFLWESGTMLDLGTLGGAQSRAYGINNAGEIIGSSENTLGQQRAFLWKNGDMTDLGDLGSGYSWGHDINEAGQVVGLSHNASGQGRAFLWENGTMTDLGDLGGGVSSAQAINDAGQVVGYSEPSGGDGLLLSGDEHAFLWENGQMIDLGTLGGASSYAESINNTGQIVGYSENPAGDGQALSGDERPFLWENGSLTELSLPSGTTTGIPHDINTSGQVTGYFVNASGAYAFLWESDITEVLLPVSGGVHTIAIAINELGHVTGVVMLSSGRAHAFFSMPASSICDEVTEIPTIECSALVDFYDSTNGSSWMFDTGWLTTNTPCQWIGITCIGGHVTGIALALNGVSGAIPESFGNLTELQSLDLSWNQLNSLPDSFGNLTRLQTLYLNNNQLSALPESVGSLASVQELYLHNNQLSNLPASFGNLTSLHTLYLHVNLLSTLPETFGNLINLQVLRLESNHLSALPESFGNLTNLRILYATSNQLSGLPDTFGNLTSLQVLYLWGNQLSGLPTSFSSLTSLQELNVSLNKLDITGRLLVTFLNAEDPDWAQTQTIAPKNLQLVSVTETSVELSWTPILYTGGNGYYEIGVATTPGGPYTILGTTANKLASSFTVDGLTPNTIYYIAVRTYSERPDLGLSWLSGFSQEVSNWSNTPPDAIDDIATGTEDTPVTILVLTNDIDADGDELSVGRLSQPANGTVTSDLVYTPNPDFNGIDSFTYVISDGAGGFDTATVLVDIRAVNDLPVAVNDSYIINEGQILNVAAPGVLGNDYDVDSDPLTIATNNRPAKEVRECAEKLGCHIVILYADGSFSYTPQPNFNGVYSFNYAVNDGQTMNNSGPATVTINVNAVNNAPAVQVASTALVLNEGDLFSGSGWFEDIDSASWSAIVDFGDGSGMKPLVLNDDQTFSLTHTYANQGSYILSVSIIDLDGGVGVGTLEITVNNAAPTMAALTSEIITHRTTFSVDADFSDVGVLDTHTATIDWGDGVVEAAAVNETNGSGVASGEHFYEMIGTYVISTCVTDDAGATHCDSLTLTVEGGKPGDSKPPDNNGGNKPPGGSNKPGGGGPPNGGNTKGGGSNQSGEGNNQSGNGPSSGSGTNPSGSGNNQSGSSNSQTGGSNQSGGGNNQSGNGPSSGSGSDQSGSGQSSGSGGSQSGGGSKPSSGNKPPAGNASPSGNTPSTGDGAKPVKGGSSQPAGGSKANKGSGSKPNDGSKP